MSTPELLTEDRGGRDLTVCSCCGRWEVKGEERPKHQLRHATYCDVFDAPAAPVAAKAVSPAAITAAAKQGAIAAVTSGEDEIVDLVRRGYVTESDAMNRDF